MSAILPANAETLEVAGPEPAVAGAEDAYALRRRPLGMRLLSLYGVGAIVDAATAVYLGSFLYFYLTAVCGLSGTLTGAALGFALIVDSVADPLVGSLSDNSRSRFGRRHPFMLVSMIPIVVSLGLLFSIPLGLKGLPLLGYVLVLTLAMRFGLSGFNVPFIALGSEMSDDYHERSTIVAFRVGVGTIGTIAILVLGWGVFLSTKAGGQLHRAAYSPFAWSGAAIVAFAALLSTFGTLSARARLHAGTPGDGSAIFRLLREMGEVFRNRSFIFLFTPCLVFFVGFGASGALTIHANTFFWKLPPSIILVISLSAVPGLFAGIVVAGILTRFIEKRTTAILGLFLIAACQFLPVMLRLSGLLPATGPAPVATLIASTLLASVGSAMALVGFQSAMADAADEHDLLFSARREGLYFAGISFAAKASSGLGVAIAGLAADAIHFPNNLAALGPHVQIAWPIVRNLGLIYGPGASVITVLGVLLLFGYRLNKVSHGRILQELADRRGK